MKSKITLSAVVVGLILGCASYSIASEVCGQTSKSEFSRLNKELSVAFDNNMVGLKGLADKPILLALNCIKPIKPILPIKPIWCTGTWTLILQCDPSCNCEWVPTCLE